MKENERSDERKYVTRSEKEVGTRRSEWEVRENAWEGEEMVKKCDEKRK